MARYDGGWGFGGRGDEVGWPGYDEDYGDRTRGMQGRGPAFDDARGPRRGITWLGTGRPALDPYDEGLRGRGSPNQNVHGGLSADNLRGPRDRGPRGYDASMRGAGGGMRGYDRGYGGFPAPRRPPAPERWGSAGKGPYGRERMEGGWTGGGRWMPPPAHHGGPSRYDTGYRPETAFDREPGPYHAADARDEYGADYGRPRGGPDRSYPRPGMDRGAFGYDRSYLGGPRRY